MEYSPGTHSTSQQNGYHPQSTQTPINIGQTERLLYVLVGTVIAGYGLYKRGTALLAVPFGAFLALKGALGNSPLYERMDVNTAVRTNPEAVSVPHQQGVHVDEATIIARPVEDVYAYLRDPDRMSGVFPHLAHIDDSGLGYDRWVFKLPAGGEATFDVEIVNEVRNEVIAWRTIGKSPVPFAGAVRFKPLGDNNTEIRIEAEYVPPAGVVGVTIAKLFNMEPSQLAQTLLRDLKQRMEADALSFSDNQNLSD